MANLHRFEQCQKHMFAWKIGRKLGIMQNRKESKDDASRTYPIWETVKGVAFKK